MDGFREALEKCSLVDLGFLGYPFTWNNKRPGLANTRLRLDRAIANAEWKEKFPESTVHHLHSHASDHLPILLQTKSIMKYNTRSTRGFKFEEAWLLWEDCEAAVQEAWNKWEGVSSGLPRVKEKIAGCGVELHAWGSSKTYPDIDRIKVLQRRAESLGTAECTEENKNEFLAVSKELDDLLRKQEIFWAQRSRVSWLKHGDKNTKFFHSKASQRKRRNFIKGILNEDNTWVEEAGEVADVAINYFESMFTAGDNVSVEECLAAVQHKVDPNMQEILSSEYSAEEIKAAVFQMGPTKAPGPDGMNALFYQKFWHIVGADVITAVLDFLNTGVGKQVEKDSTTGDFSLPKCICTWPPYYR
uniref:Reverse transcriptase n=1 Tax=Quercus lobata TaxID=97700 RepID=A0A7N2N012_QUELO